MKVSTAAKMFAGVFWLFSLWSAKIDAQGSAKGRREMQSPFGDCKTYKLGGKYGHPLTHDHALKDGSKLAFYPLTNQNTLLHLHLMFQNVLFKVKIDGTMITLFRCNRFGRNCVLQAEGGVKNSDYIRPQTWNEISVQITSQQLSLYVGHRMVKSMLMSDYEETDWAYWGVVYKDKPEEHYNPSTPDYLYLVQFMCHLFNDPSNTSEFPLVFPTETPQHFTQSPEEHSTVGGATTDELSGAHSKDKTGGANDELSGAHSNDTYNNVTPVSRIEDPTDRTPAAGHSEYLSLIVGLVVAFILLIVSGIIIYFVCKNKKSVSVNEHSPLQNEQAAK